VPLIFALNLLLLVHVFLPSLSDINAWDEATYINEGRELVHGKLPRFAMNPLVAVFYAVTYLPVHASPFWLIHSCAIGRVILFGLLWFSSYLVARELARFALPLIMVALLVVSPVLARLVDNGSNALFAAMSGLALWQFLAFHQRHETKHLWLTSLFLGLAALSRNEGPVLFAIFLVLSLILCVRMKRLGTCLAACTIPFAVVVGGYVLLYGLVTGRFELGTASRSYFTFEQGHGMAYSHLYEGRAAYVEGQADARRLFGTPEENHRSILTAIRRNPSAYFHRIPLLAKQAAREAVSMYGRFFTLICFAFAARGAWELVRRKSIKLLFILLLWAGYSVLYILLCFQASHLLLPFVVVFSLASVGIAATVANSASRTERGVWSAALLVVAVYGAATSTTFNLVSASLVLLLGLWVSWIAIDQYRNNEMAMVAGCLVLLSVGLLVRFEYPLPKPRVLGAAPDEQAALFMREHLKPGAHVAAWAPGNVWIANMTFVHTDLDLRYMKSAEDLSDWMTHNNVEAIYEDSNLRDFEPTVWSLIREQIGKSLAVAFADEKGAVRVLVPAGN
jgi:hypothetical protein